MTRSQTSAVFSLTRCALLSAMAAALYWIEIPVVAFYSLDLSTLPAILAGFSMGPAQGLAVVVVKNLVHMLGTSTAGIGELADMLISGAYVVTAGLVYRGQKSRWGALVSMAAGTAMMTAAGVAINYFLLIPAYVALMSLTPEAILQMAGVGSMARLLILLTGPFNVLKGCVLSAAAWLLYKRVSPLLHERSPKS